MPVESDVRSLLSRYCHAMDGDDVQALLDCFTADGGFRYFAVGEQEPMLDYRGHEQLAAWFAEHRESTPIGSQTHVTVNPDVAVDGSEGEVHSTYLSVREGPEGGIVITATGRYHDRVTRGDDGRWRFADRICQAFMPRA